MGELATMESVQVPVRAAILKGDLRLPASAQGLVIFRARQRQQPLQPQDETVGPQTMEN